MGLRTYLNNIELKTEMEKLSSIMEKLFSTMRRAINEAAEVKCPYSFVLTSQKLGPSSEQPSSESREQLILAIPKVGRVDPVAVFLGYFDA